MIHSPAIQQLFDEHDKILQTVNDLKELLKKIASEAGELSQEELSRRYNDEIRGYIRFFTEFGDGIHHKKEEVYLFPAMVNHHPDLESGIIGEFEDHHEQFREYLTEIQGWLIAADWLKTVSAFEQYLQLLEDHIAAENDELFVLAEDLIPPDEMERIFFSFQDLH